MRISQDVRRYAEERGLSTTAAIEAGMAEQAARFAAAGGRLRLPLVD